MSRIPPILIFLLITVFSQADATVQEGWKFYWSPEISIGYTFGLGLSTGMMVDFGYINPDQSGPFDRYALTLSGQRIRQKKGDRVHRQRAIMATCMIDNFNARIGYGRTKVGWGYNNNNACRVRGLSTDLSYTVLPNDINWRVGLKSFYYERSHWRWFNAPYETLYFSGAYPF